MAAGLSGTGRTDPIGRYESGPLEAWRNERLVSDTLQTLKATRSDGSKRRTDFGFSAIAAHGNLKSGRQGLDCIQRLVGKTALSIRLCTAPASQFVKVLNRGRVRNPTRYKNPDNSNALKPI